MTEEAAEAIGNGIAWAGFFIGCGIGAKYLVPFILMFIGGDANPHAYEFHVHMTRDRK